MPVFRVYTALAVAISSKSAFSAIAAADCTDGRPPASQRNFVSTAIDNVIDSVAANMSDPDLACIFRNTLPNTLDTTVTFPGGFTSADAPLPFVITGDITAMWLRDSTNQVLPYMPFAPKDASLQAMLRGLIARQAKLVNLDAYANAFTSGAPTAPPSPHTDDQTSSLGFLGTRVDAMVPGVFERKYELDSLCAFLKLSRSYFEQTGDTTPFTAGGEGGAGDQWLAAVQRVVEVMTYMQTATADDGSPEYVFQREALEPTDTLSHGVGNPVRGVGLIRSAFRPSDDATTYQFLIPANAMAVVELRRTAALLRALAPSWQQRAERKRGAAAAAAAAAVSASSAKVADALAAKAEALADVVDKAIQAEALVTHPAASTQPVYAYEVDGFGNHLFMDDANVPSLLSLPYLGYLNSTDEAYQRTRAAVLGPANPWWFNGTAASGVGGPHVGINSIWPMAIIMQALTSTNDDEIADCLQTLKDSTAGSGFMHESFNKDNFGAYTRPWFAWANSLFGELILKTAAERPHLIF